MTAQAFPEDLPTPPKLPMILALDPGGTTGICLYDSVRLSTEVEELGDGQRDHHIELWEMLGATLGESYARKVELHIVCEQFEFRMTERHRDFINYVPREYIGVVKLFCQIHRIKLFMQSAAQAKAFFNDAKVKKLDLWVPGKRHAMDATRHYLYHRIFILDDKTLFQKLR